jgi:hypothetical protein
MLDGNEAPRVAAVPADDPDGNADKRGARMTEFLHRHKQRLSIRRYEVDEIALSHEIVPSIASAAVQAFAAELSPEPPVNVLLMDNIDDGLYGWPADGIRERIRTRGGSIGFGWRLREWPCVLLTAEFHAVWVDPEGVLVDITPAVIAGETSAFVPDPTYPETFDFDQHPPNRYKVLHVAPDRSADVARRIAQMKPSQRAYEERRATKVGKTLEDWILGKFPTDPLVQPIAAFVDACQAFEAELPGLVGLIETDPHAILDGIIESAGLGDAASTAVTTDAPVVANIDDAREQIEDAREQDVYDEPAPAADATSAEAPHEPPHDLADAPAEVAGDATGDSVTSDETDDGSDDAWLPEDETAAAEERLFAWSDARYNRRRDLMRLLHET